jgi:hypothetical protein
MALSLCSSRLHSTVVSASNPELERDRFNFHVSLIERWDKPSMIGAFLFVGSLTIFLLLSFIGFATIPEAVQIFIIGVVMFILIFRYFKELTVGPITSKPGTPNIINLTVEGKSVRIDPSSGTDKNSCSKRPELPKGDPRLEKS